MPVHSESKLITIIHLTMSKEFQVRSRLDERTVNRYVSILKSGSEMPSVKVAKVDDVLILVDGYHRVEAMKRLGYYDLIAEVVEASMDDAKWMAASANLTHGLPLKNAEIRESFRVYVRTKQYVNKKPLRGLKPYSEIAQVFGKSKGTIWNWMKKDFPSVAIKYSGEDHFKGIGGLVENGDRRSEDLALGLSMLSKFTETFQGTTSSEVKSQLQEAFISTARALMGDSCMDVPAQEFDF